MSYISGGGGSSIATPVTVPNGGTGLITITDHAVMIGSGVAAVTPVGPGATGTVLKGVTGADPSFAAVDLTADVTGALPVTNGGTGLATLTDHSVLIGSGVGAVTPLAVGATNQVLLGSTGADPSWGTVPNAALTNSSITLSDGANITVTGSPVSLGGTATIAVSGCTQYAVQVGDATNSLDSLALGTANQILQSGGAGANPAWSTATYPATTSQGDVLYSSADNTVGVLAKDATATRYLANTGASNNPQWDQVNLTNGVTGTLPVGSGGTGDTTFTDHSILVGSGASAFTAIGAATDGQLPIGSTGNDPVLATLTAGTNISITNAAGSITINNTATAGIPWSEITGTSQAAAINTGYVANNVALVTVTLPDTAALGSVVEVVGKGAGKFKIAQNAGETIYFGGSATTTGVGGSLTSDIQYGAIKLVCITADTDWIVASSSGNFVIV